MFEGDNWTAVLLTLKLASIVTVLLLIISTPLAWWLARSKNRFKVIIEAIVALPIVLPPSVIGFYLLIAMGPEGPVGKLTQLFGIQTLSFTFEGLVIASIFYSLPFVVQPLHVAFQNISDQLLEAASTLRAHPLDRFITIVLPLSMPGILTGSVLGFAHTLGEFGVVLMIGGNIPEETRVVSVQIYDYVESLEYAQAHQLSAFMLLISFISLILLYTFNPNKIKTI